MPYYEFRGHRQALLDFFVSRERADQNDEAAHAAKGLKAYWEEKNMRSIDGIPALQAAPKAAGVPSCTDVMKRAEASINGNVRANGSAVSVKTGRSVERRRVEELVFAFALGVAVAAVYVRFVGVA